MNQVADEPARRATRSMRIVMSPLTRSSAMAALPDTPEAQPNADEVNRLWQHGMHEERLFHDRLNYFSAIQAGLLAVFAILYNKEPAVGVFVPLTTVALAFDVLWLYVQVRHWRYCVHVNEQIKRAVPE